MKIKYSEYNRLKKSSTEYYSFIDKLKNDVFSRVLYSYTENYQFLTGLWVAYTTDDYGERIILAYMFINKNNNIEYINTWLRGQNIARKMIKYIEEKKGKLTPVNICDTAKIYWEKMRKIDEDETQKK
jgi:hypothetical protein